MKIVVILNNIRSNENVGSIFRTADAVGVSKIFLCGYTPTPTDRFGRARADLAKVALGAEKNVEWEHSSKTADVLKRLKKEGFQIVAIEQAKNSIDYKNINPRTNFSDFLCKKMAKISSKTFIDLKTLEKEYNSKFGEGVKPKYPIAIVVGNEVGGINKKTLELCDIIAEIPMKGKKESLNVSVAFGIAGYKIFK